MAQTDQQTILVRKIPGPDEPRGACDHLTVGELNTVQPISLDHQPRDLTVNHPEPRVRWCAADKCFQGTEWRIGVQP